MRGFLKPKNVIVWFGVLIKVHLNSDPMLGPRFKFEKKKNTHKKKHTHTHKNNDGLSFQLNDYNLLRVVMRFKCV